MLYAIQLIPTNTVTFLSDPACEMQTVVEAASLSDCHFPAD